MGSIVSNSLPVSVIIPCYRCAETIERAVDSVLNQTQVPEEIILVDDFSDDGSATISALKMLKQKYQKFNIQILELEKNQGPGSARNEAWKRASKTYIAFLDADDSWHPKKLELQHSWMNGHPEVLFTAHSSIQISKISSKIKFNNSKNFYPLNVIKFLFFNCIPTRSVMLKRNVRYRFLSGKRYAEDYLLWLQILLNGHRGFYSKSILAFSYKDDFGRAGLSANLWAHQKGELLTYKTIYMQKLISTPFFIVLYLFSLIKFSKRIIVFFISKFSCH